MKTLMVNIGIISIVYGWALPGQGSMSPIKYTAKKG